MHRWLVRAGLVFIVAAVAFFWGNLEALGCALFIATASIVRRGRPKTFRVALMSAWSIVVVLTASVAVVGAGPRTATRRDMIFRLYDVNCSAPFKTYRYPRAVVWLAEENSSQDGSWNKVLVCGSWIK